MSYALYEGLAGLRTWRQTELSLRRRITSALVETVETTLLDINRGWAAGLRGLLANMQEVYFFPLSDKACPILFYIPGGWLVIMPRCKSLSNDDWKKLQDEGISDYSPPIPVEFKRDSFGVLNNKIVAIDYGS